MADIIAMQPFCHAAYTVNLTEIQLHISANVLNIRISHSFYVFNELCCFILVSITFAAPVFGLQLSFRKVIIDRASNGLII